MTDSVWAEIKRRVDLVSLIEAAGVKGHKSGGSWVCRCMFHADKTASLSVATNGLWHCFGCNESGDVFTWFELFHGLSKRDALVELAAIAGVELPDRSPTAPKRPDFSRRDQLYSVNEWAAVWFRSQIREETRAYLRGRGVTDEVIHAFRLGEAPNTWHGLTSDLQDHDRRAAAVEVGLVRRKESSKGINHFDGFRGRLMCPIFTPAGRVAGFSGRRLVDPPKGPDGKEIDDGNGPKYLNSCESAVYDKGTLLYGLHQAWPTIRTERRLIVVEGNVDVMAMHSVGYTRTVAPCGTALTAEHIAWIAERGLGVVLMMDGDKAGRRAVAKLVPALLAAGIDVHVVLLDKDVDPADLVRDRGAAGVEAALAKARPAFEIVLEDALEQPEDATPARKASAFDTHLRPVLLNFSEGASRDLHARQTAEYLDVSLDQVLAWLGSSSAGAEAVGSSGKRPMIVVKENDLERMCDEAERALVLHEPDIYARGRMLVELDRNDPMGAFVEISAKHFARIVDRSALWRKEVSKRGSGDVVFVPVTVPKQVVEDLFHAGSWKHIKPLISVTRIPTIRPDGTLLDVPGYDAASQCYYVPSVTVPPVPAEPTMSDAMAALAEIDELYEGFEFETPEGRSAAYSSLIAAVVRPAMRLCPMYLIDGTMQSVGKGKLANIMGITVTGEELDPVPIYQDEDKTQKAIEASLIGGEPFVLLDDMKARAEVQMKFLDRWLTSPRASMRLHYSNLPFKASVSAMFVMTGNNLRVRSDLVQRCIHVRLTSKTDQPQRRVFKGKALEQKVRDRRASTIRAVLTIVRAFIVAGEQALAARPSPNRGFVDWDRLVRFPLIWLGQPDPLSAQDAMAKTSDVEAETFRTFVASWKDTFGCSVAKTSTEVLLAIQDAVPHKEGRIDPAYELKTVLQGITRTKLRDDPSSVGRVLAGFVGKRSGAMQFTRGERAGRSTYQMVYEGSGDTPSSVVVAAPVVNEFDV